MPSDPKKRAEQQKARREARRLADAPPTLAQAASAPPAPAPAAPRYANEAVRLLSVARRRSSDGAVAKALGVSRTTTYRWDEGVKPRPHAMQRALEVYKVPLEAWHQEAQPEPPPPTPAQQLRSLAADGTFARFVERNAALPLVLSRPQRVMCSVGFDGADPGDMPDEDREVAYRLLGGRVDRISPAARRRVVIRMGRASGKSTVTALWLVWRALTATLAQVGSHEVPACVCIARNVRTAQIVFGMVQRILQDVPTVAERIETERSTDTIFQRPGDNRTVRISVVVRSAGGLGVRGIWILGCVHEESEFTSQSGPDAAIRDEDQSQALAPRLTEGAQEVFISSAWAAESYSRTLFHANRGAPHTAVAMMGETLWMRDNDLTLSERRAELMNENRDEALREFDCIETSADGALIDSSLVLGAVRALIQPTGQRVVAAADFAFVGDASALIIGERQADRFVVTRVEVRRPQGRPLVPSLVVGEFCRIALACGATMLAVADTHEIETVRAAAVGLAIVDMPNKREEHFRRLAALFAESRISVPDEPTLIRQLRAIGTKTMPGGTVSIVLPRTKELAHCDAASALVTAAWWDSISNGAYPPPLSDVDKRLARFEERPPSEYAKSGPAVPYRHPDPRINQSVPGGPALIQVRGLWRGIT